MQDRHQDRQRYFREQAYTTEKYVTPFVAPYLAINSSHRIMEVGCGEGGNLAPFADMGCECVGVDINAKQIERAKEYYADHANQESLCFLATDVYEEVELGNRDENEEKKKFSKHSFARQ